ncbi:HNH endonuclease signature motif containing protein [Frankia casuarinae]|uniref:HNH nuclease n=2 Tax=Frankiaceae TaxID=74712 RepID=Q2JEV8_FRACC|nr:HNH endonuclease signature motif containing protein [Frankia casuarinae]ABD10184.1 HNH nuclease [Frankia casuarinae]
MTGGMMHPVTRPGSSLRPGSQSSPGESSSGESSPREEAEALGPRDTGVDDRGSLSRHLDSSMVYGHRVAELDADGCLRADVEIGREIARWEAARLLVRARFAQLRPPTEEDESGVARGFHEFAGDELAAELRMSSAAGNKQLGFAVGVVRRMPAALTALEHGELDSQRLTVLERLTANLSDDQAADVAETVLRRGGRPSHAAFAAAVRRRVVLVDPQGAEQRRRRATKARRVTVRAEPDGMGRISASLPADRMLAAFRRVDLLARRAGGAQDGRGLEQRRADVFYDLLMGRDRDRVSIEMQVVVSASCLLGMSERPAELPGYGPIPAGLVREMAENPRCTWRRILMDPPEGRVLEVSRRRFPSAALARHVRTRNPTCVFPGCEQPSIHCDLDHTRPHRRGGQTSERNLGPKCRRHHRLKHSGEKRPRRDAKQGATRRPGRPGTSSPDQSTQKGWSVCQPRPGHFTWTSPEGRQYEVSPEDYLKEVFIEDDVQFESKRTGAERRMTPQTRR